jgi:hypothetical protein
MLKETRSLGNNAHQPVPEDTWIRDEPVDGESMAMVSHLTSADNSVDAFTHGVGEGELRALLGLPNNADLNKMSEAKKISESTSQRRVSQTFCLQAPTARSKPWRGSGSLA